MFIYLLPLSPPRHLEEGPLAGTQSFIPSPDGGLETTEAAFDYASVWLARAKGKEINLPPPQAYLLTLLAPILGAIGGTPSHERLSQQREELLRFLQQVPTSSLRHHSSDIPWADKVISPRILRDASEREDGRVVLGLDSPGPELEGSKRGGDFERVVLARFSPPRPPEDVEVKGREDVLGLRTLATKL